MSGSASLRASGLIKIDENYRSGLDLEPMDGLCEALMAENENEQALLSHFLVPAKPATLGMTDYPHVRADVELLQGMLAASLKQQENGVNVLVYGTPGSGKTELTRLLAKSIGVNLFDEVEDVFPSRGFSFFGMEVKSGENKGWINKALQENKTPAIWICNQINQIDPAFLRRFDYAMELNTPPRSVRLNIVRSRLAGTPVSEPFMQRLSEHEELSPAQVAKAAKVLERMACVEQKAAEGVLEKVLGNSAKAMGQKPLVRKQAHATHYSLDYLNANVDLPRLVEGLQRSKRASDILSKWVGGSEQNIARMFEQARSEDAVLILDEADSLLRDRRGAKNSWEVTQVNELLVQMENFDGLFICSTNLMDDLDQASLRRFAIKVEFDYLKQEQAVKMLQKECTTKPTHEDARAITMLSNLAPGDFAAVKKRLDILGLEAKPNVMIQELHAEVLVNHDSVSKPIGFISSKYTLQGEAQ